MEINWLHNTKTFGTQMDGVEVKLVGTRNIGEIKTGVEGQLNPNLNLWGNIAQKMGDKGNSGTQAMIDIRYIY